MMTEIERVRAYLAGVNPSIRVLEFDESTRSAELAAQVLGVETGAIAKSILFRTEGEPVLVVTSGDKRVDSQKLKATVGASKVYLADPGTVMEVTGFPVGGVAPVAHRRKVRILLDESLKRFPVVYAAAGTPRSAMPVTWEELQKITAGEAVDICN